MKAVQNFKYNSDIYIGEFMSDLLAQSLLDMDWLEEVDALCPIPIHWTRRLSRGFNQANIIADRLSAPTHLPVISLLSRVRPTPQQVGLSAAARAENIKDAFRTKRFWPIEGATICLVDDVMTTGATLYEAARTLKRAGAKTVYAAVLAKAQKDSTILSL
jgi:ComF family protein